MQKHTENEIEKMSFADLKAMRDYCIEQKMEQFANKDHMGIDIDTCLAIVTNQMQYIFYLIFGENEICQTELPPLAKYYASTPNN